MNTNQRHKQSYLIPAKTGYALKVNTGSLLRITDLEGQQVIDFVAYDATDANHRLIPA